MAVQRKIDGWRRVLPQNNPLFRDISEKRIIREYEAMARRRKKEWEKSESYAKLEENRAWFKSEETKDIECLRLLGEGRPAPIADNLDRIRKWSCEKILKDCKSIEAHAANKVLMKFINALHDGSAVNMFCKYCTERNYRGKINVLDEAAHFMGRGAWRASKESLEYLKLFTKEETAGISIKLLQAVFRNEMNMIIMVIAKNNGESRAATKFDMYGICVQAIFLVVNRICRTLPASGKSKVSRYAASRLPAIDRELKTYKSKMAEGDWMLENFRLRQIKQELKTLLKLLK